MSKDYGKIRRGFKPLLSHMEKGSKYFATCSSCASYYATSSDPEEHCNNNGVTQFDMCSREDGTVYCCYWKSVGMQAKAEGKR